MQIQRGEKNKKAREQIKKHLTKANKCTIKYSVLHITFTHKGVNEL